MTTSPPVSWTPERIKALRQRIGWSGLELGTFVGSGPAGAKTLVSNWECGRCAPHPQAAEALDNLWNVLQQYGNGDGSQMTVAVLIPFCPAEEWPPSRVLAFRRSLEWLQKDLAAALGCVPEAVCQWERGNHRPGGRMRRLLTMLERDVKAHPDIAWKPDLARRRLRLGGVPVQRRPAARPLIR